MKQYTIFIQESNVNFFSWYITERGFYDPLIEKVGGVGLTSAVMLVRNGIGKYAVDIAEWDRIGTKVAVNSMTGHIHSADIVKKSLTIGKECIRMSHKVIAKSAMCTSSQALLYFRKLVRDLIRLTAVGFVPVESDYHHFTLSTAVRDVFWQRKYSPEKIATYATSGIASTRMSFARKERIAFLELCLAIICAAPRTKLDTVPRLRGFLQDHPALLRRVQNHAKQWAWIEFNYQGPILTEQEVLSRLCAGMKRRKEIPALLRHTKNGIQRMKQFQSSLTKKLRLTRQEQRVLTTAKDYLYLKEYRIEVRSLVYYAIEELLHAVAPQTGFSLEELRYALPEEIEQVLQGRTISHVMLRQRERRMVAMTSRETTKIFSGKAALQIEKQYVIEEQYEAAAELSGQVAFPGVVTGIVRIVRTIHDIDAVRHQDILVAPTTVPDYVPAMRRAAAIVTDSGGITSHAAIVAREFKKPCIIGTKVGTRTLKNGDRVVVDAVKGIVRKV